jgi:hypothetical protein
MDNFTCEMFADFDVYQARMENEAIPYEDCCEDYIPGFDDGEWAEGGDDETLFERED